MTQTPAQQKPRLWVRLVLVGSLAMNLLIIGAAAGLYLNSASRDGVRPPPGTALFRAMPRADRKALRKELRGVNRNNREGIRALAAALSGDTVDLIALRAAMDAQARQMQGAQGRVADLWIERVAQMSVEERKAYSARILENLERRKGGRPPRRD